MNLSLTGQKEGKMIPKAYGNKNGMWICSTCHQKFAPLFVKNTITNWHTTTIGKHTVQIPCCPNDQTPLTYTEEQTTKPLDDNREILKWE